ELRASAEQSGTAAAVVQIEQIIQARNLEIVRDTAALDAAIAAAMTAKPDAVRDFRSGKQNALGPLIGMIMKQVAGADPKQVRERLISAVNSGE
ncbi:MAG: Asp-tRNA(Asn)/Glu-tRNA(Gln) amidotransferase GatCAB subunit B, partial [Planctomycetaceae bacterium]